MTDFKQEYERIKALFVNVDENQLALVDGAIIEAARLRVELDRLNDIVKVSFAQSSNADMNQFLSTCS